MYYILIIIVAIVVLLNWYKGTKQIEEAEKKAAHWKREYEELKERHNEVVQYYDEELKNR